MTGCGPQVDEFRRQKVTILWEPTAVNAGLDMCVDNVRRYAANLDQSIVLNEYGVAWQIAVSDWRVCVVQITSSINEFDRLKWPVKNSILNLLQGSEKLYTPPLPGALLNWLIGSFGFP